MLMLRLQRVGRRNEAHFKIVVIEKTKGPKSQKYVDIVGSYNPKLGLVNIDEEKAKKWLSNGVQPSDTVRNMLITKGILDGKKINVLPHKSPVVDEEKIAREKEEAEAKEIKDAEEKEAGVEEAPEEKTEESSSENGEIEDSSEENAEENTEENIEEKAEEAVVEDKKEDE